MSVRSFRRYDARQAAIEPLESRRLFNAGDRDFTFGHHGVAAQDVFTGPKFNIYEVDIQPDGKTVVAGLGAETGAGSVVVGRLNVDGSVDQSFGINGRWDFTGD